MYGQCIDFAPLYKAIIMQEFLAKTWTNVIDLTYSSGMAPSDIFLFPRLKLALRGRRFELIEGIKGNSPKYLKTIFLRSADEKCIETRSNVSLAVLQAKANLT